MWGNSVLCVQTDETDESKEKKNKVQKKEKDPNAPKKPLSAYMLFSNCVRKPLKDEAPQISPKELMTLIGDRWKNLEEDAKEKFQEQAKVEQERYKRELAEYTKQKEYTDCVRDALEVAGVYEKH